MRVANWQTGKLVAGQNEEQNADWQTGHWLLARGK
jgi:hypothetical protein